MYQYESIVQSLSKAYDALTSNSKNMPEWAVHKRTKPEEIVRPTIPFVGRNYPKQDKKILVYGSAENLADYHIRKMNYWSGSWLDNDDKAKNRHRICFDDNAMQASRNLPYVHLGPLEDGGLLVAVMYIASKYFGVDVKSPADFYEKISFGNYGKFSIETPVQEALRTNPELAQYGMRKIKQIVENRGINEDYAAKGEYLEASHEYIRADIGILQPDYIIMPEMADKNFLESVKGKSKIIQIYQMNPTVVNSLAKREQEKQRKPYEVSQLPETIKETYESIRRINLMNYRYVFDYLDRVIPPQL